MKTQIQNAMLQNLPFSRQEPFMRSARFLARLCEVGLAAL